MAYIEPDLIAQLPPIYTTGTFSVVCEDGDHH